MEKAKVLQLKGNTQLHLGSDDDIFFLSNGGKHLKVKKTIKVKTGAVFLNKSLIMFQKIANILSIVSFVMVASMSGGTYFAYKYFTSEQFKSKMMNESTSACSHKRLGAIESPPTVSNQSKMSGSR